jgi:HlyD family secretion protein
MSQGSKAGAVLKILAWLCILAGAGAGGAYYYLQEPALDVTVAEVATGRVEETIAAISSGTVVATQSARVASAGLGVIGQVHVAEGQAVSEGDLLVELEHAELDAQVALTQANLLAGRSRVEQARLAAGIFAEVAATRLAQARAQLDSARTDFDRIKALADKKAIAQTDFDKVALALRVAQETHAAAQAGVKENAVRDEEVVMAEAALTQLEAAVAVAEATRDKAFVRAPFDGVVTRVILKKGEAVAMGVPLLEVVETQKSHIEAPFDEADAARIAAGQPARITLDAYPRQEFDGEVVYVSPVVTINPNLSRTLTVKVRAVEGGPAFLPGMSADIVILSEAKEDVVFVPSESLIRDEYVYVVEGDRAVRRDVALGIGNWEYREVLSGLRPGDRLITSIGQRGLDAGVKVRAVATVE